MGVGWGAGFFGVLNLKKELKVVVVLGCTCEEMAVVRWSDRREGRGGEVKKKRVILDFQDPSLFCSRLFVLILALQLAGHRFAAMVLLTDLSHVLILGHESQHRPSLLFNYIM